MSVQTRTYSSTTDVVTGATIAAAHLNTDLDKLYTLQNGAIDNDNISASAAIAISKTALGTYTAATTWVPTWTGVSVAPTGVGIKAQIGNMGFIGWTTTGAGTSDNTAFYITNLPFTPSTNFSGLTNRVYNNGGLLTSPGLAVFTGSSATLEFKKDIAGAAWTAANGKYVDFGIWYPIA